MKCTLPIAVKQSSHCLQYAEKGETLEDFHKGWTVYTISPGLAARLIAFLADCADCNNVSEVQNREARALLEEMTR